MESVDKQEVKTPYKMTLVWRNVFYLGYLHLAALYGLYLCFTSARIFTTLWALFLFELGIIGITAGAHRLWTHRAYKAKLPLQVILLVFNSIAFMDTATSWVRDHRLHHKYTDTDADPHNSNRGLFFSQIGWLFVKKHPDIKEKGKTIYMEDIYNDPLLKFQKKYALFVIGMLSFVIPTVVPMYYWNESFSNSWHVATMLRYCTTINVAFLVNSVGHVWGMRPYDKSIKPVENLAVSFLTSGEGFHNYHHVFPYDYKASELGNTKFNFSTMFINFFAKIGWAYDLKSIPDEMVIARSQRTGDGINIWGWGDKDQTEEETKSVNVIYSKSN